MNISYHCSRTVYLFCNYWLMFKFENSKWSVLVHKIPASILSRPTILKSLLLWELEMCILLDTVKLHYHCLLFGKMWFVLFQSWTSIQLISKEEVSLYALFRVTTVAARRKERVVPGERWAPVLARSLAVCLHLPGTSQFWVRKVRGLSCHLEAPGHSRSRFSMQMCFSFNFFSLCIQQNSEYLKSRFHGIKVHSRYISKNTWELPNWK